MTDLAKPQHPARQTAAPDPNLLQASASDPTAHVWVEASAGSGKTKVLTDRLLRLLLAGVAPNRILCLTFTKAGAAEMANRLNGTLLRFAQLPDHTLGEDIRKLTGTAATPQTLTRARGLFALLTDSPGGLAIQTIHSFCQSVLGRFPLEAGVSPRFRVLEESVAQGLQTQARDHVLGHDPEGQQAAYTLINTQSDFVLADAIARGLEGRESLAQAQRFAGGTVAALDRLLTETLPEAMASADDIEARMVTQLRDVRPTLLCLVEALTQAGTEKEKADKLPKWEALCEALADGTPHGDIFALWCELCLTKKGTYVKKMVTKAPLKHLGEAQAQIIHDLETVHAEVAEGLANQATAERTRAAVGLVARILERFTTLKAARLLLDYDDLIALTQGLLTTHTAAWVHYKLDGGLDHILVDEAQDTSPAQWSVVLALMESLMAVDRPFGPWPGGDPAQPRTLFVVGDRKQSIFSFQGADVAEFARVNAHLRQQGEVTQRAVREVPMGISFRSAQAVLDVVDATFNDPSLAHAIVGDAQAPRHSAFHAERPGRVELWPMLVPERQDDTVDPWAVLTDPVTRIDGQTRLAWAVAARIHRWLSQGERLVGTDRAIRAGDIMVLVARRTRFVQPFLAACRQLRLPVSGLDRMHLGTEISVQDLLLAVRTALLPEDDLRLASLLRSPFIDLSEQALEDLCYGRDKRALWSVVRDAAQQNPDLVPIVTWIRGLQDRADTAPPYEMVRAILDTPCPANATSGLQALIARLGPDILDPLEEALSIALSFQLLDVPTLEGFVAAVETGATEIKREMEQAGGKIRVLTVHASKGLEAPIVILPDTAKLKTMEQRWYWPARRPDETTPGAQVPPLDRLPLVSGRKAEDSPALAERRAAVEAATAAERQRLLYVAMTRASHSLLVCGDAGGDAAATGGWHGAILEGLNRLDGGTGAGTLREEAFDPTAELEAAGAPDPSAIAWTGSAWHYGDAPPPAATVAPTLPGTPQADPDPFPGANANQIGPSPGGDAPSWLFEAAAQDDRSFRTARPSDRGELPSPLGGDQSFRFQRGLWIHRLLQSLPDLDPSERPAVAQRYLDTVAASAEPAQRQTMLEEVLAVLDHPEFAPLFGAGSRAEVPVVGRVGAQQVNGIIDRLVVTAEAVWIVDFKTNQEVPAHLRDTPSAYVRQLRLYRDLMAQLYPEKSVRALLLWTRTPALVDITPLL